ncbi:MAG: hypothetical protein U9P90_02280 [Patescibacteria group bacterium]|nr:hypothetical protein [Patescibacteria group bacterium]
MKKICLILITFIYFSSAVKAWNGSYNQQNNEYYNNGYKNYNSSQEVINQQVNQYKQNTQQRQYRETQIMQNTLNKPKPYFMKNNNCIYGY